MSKYFYYFLFLIGFTGCKKSPEKYNLVLILADDLGYNDVSVYRYSNFPSNYPNAPTSETPNIDKLASEGMRFTDFYSGAAVCSPSRASLLTGRNATRLGVYNWIPENSPMHLKGDEITIAELFKNIDYQTAHFGKWHLTSQGTSQPLPLDHGYDFSFFTYNNANPSHENPVNFYRDGQEVGPLHGYASHLVVDEAIGWLDKVKGISKPFYINIWFNEPHTRVAAPKEFTERHDYNGEYYGSIENMDLAVGRFMSYLKSRGLDKNTIVIFTSDNGSQWDHSNQPLRGEKCFNYEGGVRVPFIIIWPGKIKGNTISHFPGSFADILPTAAKIFEYNVPSDRIIDGIDISSIFLRNEALGEREAPIFFFRYFHDPVCMIRIGDWCLLGYDQPLAWEPSLDEQQLAKVKPWHFVENHMEFLISIEPRHFELYNLRNDPGQRINLAEKFPEKTELLKAKMLNLRLEMISEGGDWFAQKHFHPGIE